jgi:hypothetical protein
LPFIYEAFILYKLVLCELRTNEKPISGCYSR